MTASRGMRLPGTGNSFANTPDNAKWTPVTSLEVRWFGSADDWTPAAARAACQQSGFIADIGWALTVTTSGQVEFSWSPPGTTGGQITKTATQTPAAIDGSTRGLGARLILATGDVTFLASPDGLTWIEFQTDTTAPATTVFNSGQALQVGGAGAALWVGYCRWFELRVDGKIVADPAFDQEEPGSTSFEDTRGNRWTLGSAAFIAAHQSFAPTAAQILDLDDVHRRADQFRFELCDRQLRPIGDLHPDRAGSVATIDNDTTNNTARRLRGFRLLPDEADDVNPIRDRLRVYMRLQDGTEYRLGTFLWGDASEPLRSWGEQHDGDLVDFTYVLDQQTTQAYGWGRGADIALTVVFLMLRAGFTVEDLAPNNESPGRTLADPKSWQPGATWRSMISELAALSGFAPPWFDRDGRFHFESLPNPDIDPPGVTGYEPGTRIIADTIVRSDDIVAAPNDFAIVDSGTARLRIGRFQVPASAPHSFANRGFRIGQVESTQGLQNQAQADRAAFNLARANRTYKWLEFASTADPRHDTFTIVPALGEVWLETAWSLECRSGGQMKHTLRRTSYVAG